MRERCGGDPTQIVELLFEIANGGSANGKPARAADQIRAAELLLAYGWGKPPATQAPEGYDPLEADAITAEARAIVDELTARRQANGE